MITIFDSVRFATSDKTPYNPSLKNTEPTIREADKTTDGESGRDDREEQFKTGRRPLIVSAVSGLATLLVGCVSDDESSGGNDDTGKRYGDSSEDDTEETRNREVLYDTTVEDRLEEEHEFSSRDVLYVEASINHEGRGVFTLNIGPGEELRKTDIEDSKSFSLGIKEDGTHIVNAIAGGGPNGRMELLVELEDNVDQR